VVKLKTPKLFIFIQNSVYLAKGFLIVGLLGRGNNYPFGSGGV
jgi:hypothetical protein